MFIETLGVSGISANINLVLGMHWILACNKLCYYMVNKALQLAICVFTMDICCFVYVCNKLSYM